MTNKKSYTTPVWWIGFIILSQIIFAVALVSVQSRVRSLKDDGFSVWDIYGPYLITQGVYALVLLAETITYWRIRKYIVKKVFVWIHVGGLLFALSLLPLIYGIAVMLINSNGNSGDYAKKLDTLYQIRTFLFWGVVIIAHVFFALLLIDTIKKRRLTPESPDADRPDILNDYA